MADEALAPDVEAEPDFLVALYDFDPSAIDWPFRRQRPLPLRTGLVIKVLHDDGSEWVLGHPVNQPRVIGYFPKNYTVTRQDYEEIAKDYEQAQEDTQRMRDEEDEMIEPLQTSAMPTSLPEPNTLLPIDPLEDDGLPEIQIPGLASYPVLHPAPVIETTFEVNKARLLVHPPPVPRFRAVEPAPPNDPIDKALLEVQKEFASKNQSPRRLPQEKLSDSRASTPAARHLTRPDRDFVRHNLPFYLRDSKTERLASMPELLVRYRRMTFASRPAYSVDLRVRSTTCRLAGGIEPGIMQAALREASGTQARWQQMFRPQFNDIVNESYKVACNACILSRGYVEDQTTKEQFQKLHAVDTGGTMWFELGRRKDHLFYMRSENKDVMLCHPDAWGFPDANRFIKVAAGAFTNPAHGWLHQVSIDPDKEMEDVEFLYTIRLRMFPESIFRNCGMGKLPAWIEPYSSLEGEATLEDDKTLESAGSAGDTAAKTLLNEAGVEDDDFFVKIDELRLNRERSVGPDIMDTRTEAYRVKGLSAMRIFLRSKGRPDQSKQTMITPKLVKDMAAQLGILGEFKHYWYCMFALRYPLALEWEVVVRNDTRWYLHLPSDRMQPIHPMVRAFRVHLSDYIENEFLWDFRGFVRMKCGQCGVPDAVVWCMQCTDYFCTKCLHSTHKTARGKKHWFMTIPGCRYLDRKEVNRTQEYLPWLNIGFSNRRRFLATSNQSDKYGPRFGDSWLCFTADSFQAALVQCPKNHWHVKRTTPPRLAPGQSEYYYNFEHEVLADDPSHIMDATQEQAAVAILQKSFRGALTRRHIAKETEAAVVIQKTKMMWDVQKVYGDNGKNARIIKGWYMKYAARQGRRKLELLVARVQGVSRGIVARKEVNEKLAVVGKLQARYRSRLQQRELRVIIRGSAVLCTRSGLGSGNFRPHPPKALTVQIGTCRHAGRLHRSALLIQKVFRGYLHGRKLFRTMSMSASLIAALVKGVAQRRTCRRQQQAAVPIQAHWRGVRGRRRFRNMHQSALRIQRNVRRFYAQIHVKQMIFIRMNEIIKKRHSVLAEKLRTSACEIIQRNYRRYQDYQKYLFMRKEKGDSDKRTQTLIVAMFTAAGALRHHVHPWWRHLPPAIQDVLEQMKNPLQRTISNVPVRGKLANEELGKRGLRVAHVDNLTYKTPDDNPDVASHMLLCISRHLLSLVPTELFPATMKWACQAISHKAVEIARKGIMKQTIIPIGKDMPPHPGDSLASLWEDTSGCKGEIEAFIKIPDSSLPITVLHALSPHHRQVFLTANILIIMRQALDAPSLSTDDHLRFQGLDAAAGAQLMEVFGSELDHPLPLDWPKAFGTVSALAAKASSLVTELQPEKVTGHGNPSLVRRSKGEKVERAMRKELLQTGKKGKTLTEKDGGKFPVIAKSPRTKKKIAEEQPKEHAKVKKKVEAKVVDELGQLAHFNRNAIGRLLQQLGYYMRDQTAIVNTILASEEGLRLDNKARGVRTSRYISVTEKMFDIADNAKHDHCSFVLAVVLFHMVIRGLMLRLMYHRAAIVVQKRYRYVKTTGKKFANLAPVIIIQRFWRGLRAAMYTMRRIDAARLIVRNYRIVRQKRHAAKLIRAVLMIQRYGRAKVTRMWLQHCHDAATFVQKFVRGLLVRVALDKSGRDMMRKYQRQMNVLLVTKDSRTETEQIARCCALAGKVTAEMVKHRTRNVEMRRALSFNVRAKHTRERDREEMMAKVGRVQPQRVSVFEPMASGREQLFAVFKPMVALDIICYGCRRSRIFDLIKSSHEVMDGTLDPNANAVEAEGATWRCVRQSVEKTGLCNRVNDRGSIFCKSCGQKRYGVLHAAAVRGHAAVVARRKAKTGKSYVSNSKLFNPKLYNGWSKAAFEVV